MSIFPAANLPASPAPFRNGLVRRLAGWVTGLLALGLTATATTVNPPEFPQLVNESDYIVRATVKSVSSVMRLMPSGKSMPFTRVELEVKQVVAGKPPTPLVLEVLGGRTGGRELSISGAPKFAVGEESILFVQGNGRQIFPLVRMAHGVYPIAKEAATGREYVVRSDGAPLRSVSEVSRPIHTVGGKPGTTTLTTVQAATQALSPDDFVVQIRANIKETRLLER